MMRYVPILEGKIVTYFPLIFSLLLSSTFTISTEAQVISSDTLGIPTAKTLKPEPRIEKPQTKSPTGALIRSALFPGWGQFYTERYIKSGLIFCLESGLIISALVQDKKAKDAYQTDYAEYLDRLDRRNGYLWWTAGVIVFSMIDAYVDAHLFGFDEDRASFRIEPSSNSLHVRFVLHIPLRNFP